MAGQVRVEPWRTGESGAAQNAAVVRVVLDHPGKLNAMSRAMWRELRVVFERLQGDTALRCIVVEGAGEAFCAGGDISEYESFRFAPDTLAAFHEDEVWAGLNAMLQCDVPMVAAIRGACMGAGVEIASCCDIRICGRQRQVWRAHRQARLPDGTQGSGLGGWPDRPAESAANAVGSGRVWRCRHAGQRFSQPLPACGGTGRPCG